jgi:hypothetical protein
MTKKTISEKLKDLIEEQKKLSFLNPKKAKDCEALGIIISQFFEWNGKGIFESSYSAFEDSNFHKFNEKFQKIWDKQYSEWKGGN